MSIRFIKTKFHLRFAINPILRYKSNRMGDLVCINQAKRDTMIIVSLTSYGERFDDLELSLYSIMNQSLKPDKIILWISDEYESINFLPYSITKYLKNGLEIRFVKDIGSYTKIIPAIREYSSSIIVTADDDIIYPEDWLKKLYHSYILYSEDIQVHRAHRITFDDDNKILPYDTWKKHVSEETARYDNFLTGVGGVLYPPNCFSKEVLREDIFLKYSKTADDIWLWVMGVISGRKIRVVQNHIKNLVCTDYIGQIGLKKKRTLFSQNKKGKNDEQLNNLLKYYGNNIFPKIK